MEFIKKISIIFASICFILFLILFSSYFYVTQNYTRQINLESIQIVKNPQKVVLQMPLFLTKIAMDLQFQASYKIPRYQMLFEDMSLWHSTLSFEELCKKMSAGIQKEKLQLLQIQKEKNKAMYVFENMYSDIYTVIIERQAEFRLLKYYMAYKQN